MATSTLRGPRLVADDSCFSRAALSEADAGAVNHEPASRSTQATSSHGKSFPSPLANPVTHAAFGLQSRSPSHLWAFQLMIVSWHRSFIQSNAVRAFTNRSNAKTSRSSEDSPDADC